MPNTNITIFSGHLARDPEIRVTPKGTQICQFTIANSKKWKDKESGQEREDVCFLDCQAWGRTAETIGKYFQKGSPIQAVGSLKLDQWDDKQSGQKRSKIKLNVESFDFVGDTGRRQQGQQQGDPNEDVPYGDSNQLPPPRQDSLPPPPQGYSYAPSHNMQPPRRQLQPPTSSVDEDVPF